MKRIFITLLALVSGIAATQAQNMNIESAILELRAGEILEAKRYIDLAAANENTANSSKMWYWKGKVYLAIAKDPALRAQAENAGVVSLESFVNCLRIDRVEKRRKFPEADDEFLEAVGPAYNFAIERYQKGTGLVEEGNLTEGNKLIGEAVLAWEQVLKAYEFDTKRQMSTVMNIPKENTLQFMADAAIKAGDNAKAFALFEEVMNSQESVPYAFTRSALLYMETGDTVKALQVIEKGQEKFSQDKDLMTLQLIIYQNQGREDLLTEKITEALQNDPENPTLLANRGNIFDNRGRAAVEALKKEVESLYELRADVKREKDPKKRAELQKTMDAKDLKVRELLAKQRQMDSLAIADYKAAYELNKDNFDVIFNLGAIYFNGALPLVEIANNLPLDANYDRDYAKIKAEWTVLYEESIVWFLKAEEIKGDDDSVLLSLQQAYAQLGNTEKSDEYRAKRK